MALHVWRRQSPVCRIAHASWSWSSGLFDHSSHDTGVVSPPVGRMLHGYPASLRPIPWILALFQSPGVRMLVVILLLFDPSSH
eukprot:gene14877-20931_t